MNSGVLFDWNTNALNDDVKIAHEHYVKLEEQINKRSEVGVGYYG